MIEEERARTVHVVRNTEGKEACLIYDPDHDYTCSLAVGHTGLHVAYASHTVGKNDLLRATWPNASYIIEELTL